MARIGTRQLAAFCRRLAVATESGIEDRKIWDREASRASGRMAVELQKIASSAQSGGSVTQGLESTGRYFPAMFREMVALGEKTGKLATIFRRLADHYDHRVQLRRAFLAGITWPMIQLFAAIFIVGFLIWVLGLIADRVGDAPYDVLGLNLKGTKGLIIYIAIVSTAAGMITAFILLLRSGAAWIRPVQSVVMRIPGIGTCLRTLAISRIAWTLGLALEAGMDIRPSIELSLRNTHNTFYTSHIPAATATIDSGGTIYEALSQTHVFPDEFLDAIDVGEQSGRLDESMLHLADIYQEQARSALAKLAVLGGFAVWALVAIMIISIIVSIVASYASFLEGLANPR